MQQLCDGLALLQGIEAQQSIIGCVAAMSGPKQPPRVANRNADSNRMGFAFLISSHDSTNCVVESCDTNHTPVIPNQLVGSWASKGLCAQQLWNVGF